MRTAQRDWARRIKDVSFLSEWEMHARSKGSTPYDMGHDSNQYDFDAIFASAELASSLDAADLPAIARLLQHKDSGVRYWAAVGLLAHDNAGVEAAHNELVAAVTDGSPMVRIAAAEALGRFGSEDDTDAALDVLLHYATPESNYFLAVAAWNALDHLDQRARPALDTIRAVSTESVNVPQRMGEYTTRLKQKTLIDLE
jgi:uncharacterized sulfatase